MKMREYLQLPKTRAMPTYVGQTYCPLSIRKSNPKVGDKIHYMEITKYVEDETSSVEIPMTSLTIELKWSILEEDFEQNRLNRLLHDLATGDFNRIRY